MSTITSLSERRITPAVTASPTCESCAHPVASHDIIATRFCRATAASALIRACICPSGAN